MADLVHEYDLFCSRHFQFTVTRDGVILALCPTLRHARRMVAILGGEVGRR